MEEVEVKKVKKPKKKVYRDEEGNVYSHDPNEDEEMESQSAVNEDATSKSKISKSSRIAGSAVASSRMAEEQKDTLNKSASSNRRVINPN